MYVNISLFLWHVFIAGFAVVFVPIIFCLGAAFCIAIFVGASDAISAVINFFRRKS